MKHLRVNVSKNQRKIKKLRTWSKNRFVLFFCLQVSIGTTKSEVRLVCVNIHFNRNKPSLIA